MSSSSDLFQSPKVSADPVYEVAATDNVIPPSPESEDSLFAFGSQADSSVGRHQTFSQWFSNEQSPFHKDKINVAGVNCDVVNVNNRRPDDTSDLEFREEFSTGSSFFDFCKRNKCDPDAHSMSDSVDSFISFKNVFQNKCNNVANESIYIDKNLNARLGHVLVETISKNSTDAHLEHPIARPGYKSVMSKQSGSKVINGDKVVVGARAKKRPGKMFFVTLNFDYLLSFADKLCALSNLRLYGNDLVSYCISKEKCERSEDSVEHLHIFLEYLEPVYIEEQCFSDKTIYGSHAVGTRSR